MAQDNKPSTKVVTGKVRLSYVYLLSPRPADEEDGAAKYSCAILIPKSDKETIAKIKAAIEAAKEKDKGKWNGKIPANLKSVFRDGDEEYDEDDPRPEIKGHYFLNASSKGRPGVVDRKLEPITDESEVYSGMYAKVSLNFYGYSVSGNKGVAAGLNNVMKIADGENLGGRTRAEDDFEAMDDEDVDGLL